MPFDLIVGARAQAEVHPLLPVGAWDWFCLDDVRYHGLSLTIIWDRSGQRYHRGAGLSVLADGKLLAHASSLRRLVAPLPANRTGR